MAVIFQACQRQSDKRWDYTRGSDEEGWTHATGYCAGWKDWTEEDAKKIGMSLDFLLKDQAKSLPFKDKYHLDGHATPEEAEACYETHELDQEMVFRKSESQQHKCESCGEWGQNMCDVGEFVRFWLCDKDCSRGVVEKLFRRPSKPG